MTDPGAERSRLDDVDIPEVFDVSGADPSLGRLGPALERWAGMQGSWPPAPPRLRRSLVMTGEEPGGVEAGVQLADTLADAGVDLLVLGSSGDPVPGMVAAAALLSMEPVQAVGTSGGADWTTRAVGVRDGLRRCRLHRDDPLALLDALDSAPLALLTGLLIQCAARRTPVLLDGSAAVVGAALVAQRVAPGARAWWMAGSAPTVPAATKALTNLGLVPLLDLGLDRPGGAELALAVLLGALELVHE